jgi:two-component system, NarL family, nitrate/nitrite response regulator NarL
MTRILLADDHPLMLSGIDSLLAHTDYEVIARLTDGNTALAAILASRPDIALIDVSMPGLSGTQILRTLRSAGSAVKVVILTAHLDDEDLLEAMRAGVEGIVHKDGGARQLVECLDKVATGGRWIPRDILIRVSELRRARADDPLNQLSTREREIAELVAQGMRNRAISEELGLTEGTVKVYLNRVYEKLGISSRTELALAINGGQQANSGRRNPR